MKREDLTKIRMSALAAVYLHGQKIRTLRYRNKLIEFLSIAVPVGYFVPRFLVSGSELEHVSDIAWEISAATLSILAVLKVVYQWQELETRHSIASRRNRDIARSAREYIDDDNIADESIKEFIKRSTDVDSDDDDLLLGTSIGQDQEAYRYSLKHVNPGKTMLCVKCGADPGIFSPGGCQACGGTPANLSPN